MNLAFFMVAKAISIQNGNSVLLTLQAGPSGPRRVRICFTIFVAFFLGSNDTGRRHEPSMLEINYLATTRRTLVVILFGPLALQGTILIDFGPPQGDIEKSTIFRIIQNRPRRVDQYTWIRPGTVLVAKSIRRTLPRVPSVLN